MVADFNRLAREGGSHRTEYRIVHADGHSICVEDTITAETDESGKVLVLRGLTRDITRQRAARVQLEESEQRFRLVADAVLDAVMIHEAGTIMYVNKTALHLLGYEENELIGKSGEVIVPEKTGRRRPAA